MSIHDIITKINTDKREIGFSRLKSNIVLIGYIVLMVGQAGVFIYVFLRFK
jgi:hypothetical protein